MVVSSLFVWWRAEWNSCAICSTLHLDNGWTPASSTDISEDSVHHLFDSLNMNTVSCVLLYRNASPLYFLRRDAICPIPLLFKPLFPSSPVNFVLPSFENGLIATSKIAYRIFNNELNNLSSTLFSHWHDIGYLEPSTKLNWNLIYQLPTSKKEGDTQFRLLHNHITAARYSSSFQSGFFFVVWMVWGKGNDSTSFHPMPSYSTRAQTLIWFTGSSSSLCSTYIRYVLDSRSVRQRA